MVTHEEVKKRFNYDPETGVVTRAKFTRTGPGKIDDVVGWSRGDGYLSVEISGKAYRLHRIIWLWVTGKWPVNEVDHVDRNRLNNKWVNLRAATHSQNQVNSASWSNTVMLCPYSN